MILVKRVYHYQCETTETVGMMTEQIICNILGIKFQTKRQVHMNQELLLDISQSLGFVLKNFGTWKHCGHLNTQSDYVLDNQQTVSIKTMSIGDNVCPQNIGQSSLGTFNKYFDLTLENTNQFKQHFITYLKILLTEYLKNLFTCHHTFVFMYSDGIVYHIVRDQEPELKFQGICLSTTKTTDTWKESNTIKIDAISLAQIQVHNNRNCLKFRFHWKAILKFIESKVITGLQIRKHTLQNHYIFRTHTLQFTSKQLPTTFNYIGSKIKLLDFIGKCILQYTNKTSIDSFIDCFSGTGVVGYYMMQNGVKRVLSNDIQHYSAIISSVWTTKDIDLNKLKNFINMLNKNLDTITEQTIESSEYDFIYNHYTPIGNRMYFTKLNGYKIDKARQAIENQKSLLTNQEYRCLLKILLYAVTSISNITSVYGAYLKTFKATSLKTLTLDTSILDWLINDHTIEHQTYNQDIFQLVESIDTRLIQCCYLDSPYNHRNYADNYHVLETISRYDSPELKGKTGLRIQVPCSTKAFTSKTTTKNAFESLLQKIQSKYVFISYNSESIVGKQDLIEIMTRSGWQNVKCIEQDYTRFKSNSSKQQKGVIEYLFCGTQII